MEHWAEIRRLHLTEKMPIKAIARRLGVARNTVRAALAAAEPPRYERPAKGSALDALEPRIVALLTAVPGHAGDRDRRAARLHRGQLGAAGPGRGAAPAVPAGGPGRPDDL